MRRLAKNLILATAAVSAIFFVDLSAVEAASLCYEKPYVTKKICPRLTDTTLQYLDFWSKFRDTVMPNPDEPQNNNPPKEMKKPPPKQSHDKRKTKPPKH